MITSFNAIGDHLTAIEAERITGEQVCRTCPMQHTRLTPAGLAGLAAARSDPAQVGAYLAANRCDPQVSAVTLTVKADRTVSTGVGGAAQALVDSCGQHVLDKCRRCAHFAPQEVAITATSANGDGRTFPATVIVGGHCKLADRCAPKPLPVDTTKVNSCYTCTFNHTYTNDHQREHGEPVKVMPTPFERALIAAQAAPGTEGLAIWEATQHIGEVRWPLGPHSHSTDWVAMGTLKTFKGEIMGRDAHDVTLRFPTGAGDIVAIFPRSNADYRTGVVTELDDRFAIVEFHSPYHRELGLMERKTRPVYMSPRDGACRCTTDGSWHAGQQAYLASMREHPQRWAPGSTPERPLIANPDCTECGGVGTAHALPPRQRPLHPLPKPELDCPSCGARPCYYHAKAPVHAVGEHGRSVELSGSTDAQLNAWLRGGPETGAIARREATRTELVARAALAPDELNPERVLTVAADGTVTDAAGGTPDWALLRVWLRSLLANFPQHSQAIRHQFFTLRERQVRSRKELPIRAGWAKPLPVQPWAPYCSVREYFPFIESNDDDYAYGLNLRRALGDWWGDPRSNQGTNPNPEFAYSGDNYFSWKKWSDTEEFLRVTSAGERAQEAIATSARHFAQRAAGRHHPHTFTPSMVTELELAGPSEEWLAAHEYVAVTPAVFVEWLNSPVTVTTVDAEGKAHDFTADQRWACFAPGTRIFASQPVEVVKRRKEFGRLVHLTTRQGRVLSVTPEHPVLTGNGWVRADRLNVGHKVVCYGPVETFHSPDVHHVPPMIDEVFGTTAYVGTGTRMMTVGMDLDGDLVHGQINVIPTDSHLWDDLQPPVSEPATQQLLPLTDMQLANLVCQSSATEFLLGTLPTSTHSQRSRTDSPRFLAFGDHPKEGGFTQRTQRNTGQTQLIADRSTAGPQTLSQAASRLPGDISIDEIIDIRYETLSGHDVYDLTTKNGWLIANGIIAHNCYGFSNFSGGRQASRDDIAPVLTLRASEELEVPDDELGLADYFVGYACMTCGEAYEVDEAIDRGMVCTRTVAVDRETDTVLGCGGQIAWMESRGHPEERATQIGLSELEHPATRVLDDQMSAVADTARWQQATMLMQLGHGCPWWRPRGRNTAITLTKKPAPPTGEWLGRTVVVRFGAEEHEVEIKADNLDSPMVRAIISTHGATTFSYRAPHGGFVIARLVKVIDPPGTA